MKERVVAGAAYGVAAWFAYGVVESVLSTGVQLWRRPEMLVLSWQWRWIAMLFGMYVAAGAILGSCVGLLLISRRKPEHYQLAATGTVVLAFIANFLRMSPKTWSTAKSEGIALAVAGLLATALAAGLISERWSWRAKFLTTPGIASLLLLGGPWVSREVLDSGSSLAIKAGAMLLWVFVVVGFAALRNRLRGGRMPPPLVQAFWAALALGILVLAALFKSRIPSVAEAASAAQPSDKPNILLITMDTVRADHLSVYGYERDTTPNLREFSRNATVYTHSIAVSDYTLPTHASIFTGVYPEWHGAFFPRQSFDRPDRPLLAELLRSLGYLTLQSAANWVYLTPEAGLTKGFLYSEWTRPLHIPADQFYIGESAKWLLARFTDTTAFDRVVRTAADVNRSSLPWLEQIKSGHSPYVPAPPFDTRFPGKDPAFRPGQYDALEARINFGTGVLQPREHSYLISQYDGGIATEDAAIGDLLKRMRELALYDNALIVITSDHGEAFGERQLLSHGVNSVYQPLVHIPLLIKLPGQRDPRRSDELVSQVDLLPTIMDLLGARAPSGLQGRSLLRPGSDAVAVYSRGRTRAKGPNGSATPPRFRGIRRALFSGSLKLITWTNGPAELYDLAADPGEEHNLYQPEDPRALRVSKLMDSLVESAPRESSQPQRLSPSSQERLKALGYLQ